MGTMQSEVGTMLVALNVVHRYVAPALAGICVAAAAASHEIAGMIALMVVALPSIYVSSPAGGRLLARVTKTDS